MAAMITKEHAYKIVKKLDAEIETKSDAGAGRAHVTAFVYHNGIMIAHFGIRHGSNKDQSHDHIRKDLNVSPRQALDLARCPLDKAGWLAILREKGLLENETEAEEAVVEDEQTPEANDGDTNLEVDD